jgi:hypothetical protein
MVARIDHWHHLVIVRGELFGDVFADVTRFGGETLLRTLAAPWPISRKYSPSLSRMASFTTFHTLILPW